MFHWVRVRCAVCRSSSSWPTILGATTQAGLGTKRPARPTSTREKNHHLVLALPSSCSSCVARRRLVQQGIIMDRQYTFKYCSPTRSSFLSGRLPYHVNQANRAYSAVGGVDIRMTMLPEHLKTAGYGTHQIGVSLIAGSPLHDDMSA